MRKVSEEVPSPNQPNSNKGGLFGSLSGSANQRS
jgi:hypothetical protein